MADILPKLFGSDARVKLLRLFLFNPKQSFTAQEAAQRARVKVPDARRELALFATVGLIKKMRHHAKMSGARYGLNDGGAYVLALQNLLINAPERGSGLYEHIRRTGNFKLLVLSGIFIGEWEGRLDILMVGDRVHERSLRERMQALESGIGRELRYALLSTNDFFYRLNLNDHLIKDVFDYPHRIVLDRLNIGLK